MIYKENNQLNQWLKTEIQEEVIEPHVEKTVGVDPILGEDEFQFVAFCYLQIRTTLGADADPVNARRQVHGSIGFYGYSKPSSLELVDQVIIDL